MLGNLRVLKMRNPKAMIPWRSLSVMSGAFWTSWLHRSLKLWFRNSMICLLIRKSSWKHVLSLFLRRLWMNRNFRWLTLVCVKFCVKRTLATVVDAWISANSWLRAVRRNSNATTWKASIGPNSRPSWRLQSPRTNAKSSRYISELNNLFTYFSFFYLSAACLLKLVICLQFLADCLPNLAFCLPFVNYLFKIFNWL